MAEGEAEFGEEGASCEATPATSVPWRGELTAEVSERDAVNNAGTKASAADEMSAEQVEVENADDVQISAAFYDAYKRNRELLHSSDESPAQEELDKLLAKLKAIAWRVDQLHLFSPNEELDDINTTDLKFLLVPYLLAETAAATQDMARRLEVLRSAVVYWRMFGQLCERLKLAHADDMRALSLGSEDRVDANTRREEKIARYRRSKELDKKVAWLFKKRGDEFRWGTAGFDEDLERDLILALLSRAAGATVEGLLSAEAEIPMLEMMMARGGPGAGPPARAAEPREKPWCVRIQDKSELQKLYLEQVFQPDITMPTMSIAEYAEIEMQQAREKQERGQIMEARQHADEDERWYSGDRYGTREEYEDDAATYKARDWDDWKDEHPYGSGNKMANLG